MYTVLIDEQSSDVTRDGFLVGMTVNNIGVGVHYLCLAEHPYYQQEFGWNSEDFPCATMIGRTTVSLPLSAEVGDGDVSDVEDAVRLVLG